MACRPVSCSDPGKAAPLSRPRAGQHGCQNQAFGGVVHAASTSVGVPQGTSLHCASPDAGQRNPIFYCLIADSIQSHFHPTAGSHQPSCLLCFSRQPQALYYTTVRSPLGVTIRSYDQAFNCLSRSTRNLEHACASVLSHSLESHPDHNHVRQKQYRPSSTAVAVLQHEKQLVPPGAPAVPCPQ